MDKHQADEALAFAARENRAAFAQLYQRYADPIYRYLLTQVNNPSDAQDLTAQTFAAAMKQIKHYRADGSLAAWLTIIARNQAVSFYRRRRREVPLDDNTPLVAPATEDIVSQRLQMAAVVKGLQQLPAERAEVIRLRIFAELSTAETAQVMGKSEAAVKMLLHRALHDLRQYVVLKEREP